MRHAAILLLVLLPALVRADGPPAPKADVAYARPLHKLADAEARRLNCKRAMYYVPVEDRLVVFGHVQYACEAPAGVESVTVYMRKGQKATRKMVVEATLCVCFLYDPKLKSCTGILYILEDAVRR